MLNHFEGCCKQGTPCALAILLLLAWCPPDLRAQRALKFSPKVMEVLNMPPVELKNDDPPLLRLKKERFNAALNEAKARFDLYKRGLTRLPDLIDVGERLFGAEVDLYDKPEEKAQVLQRHLAVYKEAETNLEKQVKAGLATQADLERLRYNIASVEIELLQTKNAQAKHGSTPQASPQQ
jgi:multidrug resistance efflux pump